MRWLLLLILLPILALAGLFFVLTDASPLLSPPPAGAAKGAKMSDLLNLKNLRAVTEGQVLVSEAEVGFAVHEAAASAGGGIGAARIAMGTMLLRASLPVPVMSRYLNVELVMVPAGPFLMPDTLLVGGRTVPGDLVRPALDWALEKSGHAAAFQGAMAKLKGVELRPQGVLLRLEPGAVPGLAADALKLDEGAQRLMQEGMQALQPGGAPEGVKGAGDDPLKGNDPLKGIDRETLKGVDKEALKSLLKGYARDATPPPRPPAPPPRP